MTTIIDTSNGLITMLGGAVTLPTSATSISATTGMIRYNAINDEVEWYSPTGAWYTIGAVMLKGSQSVTTNTSLTQASIGNLILCNSGSTLSVTLPAISGIKQLTGFIFDSQQASVIIHPAGSDTINAGSTYTIVKGDHVTVFCSGTNWFIITKYNPFATITPYIFESVATGIVAAGSTQSGATLLAAKHNVVATVSSSTGVRLPDLTSFGVGAMLTVFNEGSNTLSVYPQTGAAINALSTNGAYSLTASSAISFVMISATLWRTI